MILANRLSARTSLDFLKTLHLYRRKSVVWIINFLRPNDIIAFGSNPTSQIEEFERKC